MINPNLNQLTSNQVTSPLYPKKVENVGILAAEIYFP
jgi:hypothetical protein